MELIYLYISNYRRLENIGFNFCRDIRIQCDWEKGEFDVTAADCLPDAFWGDNISNLVMIIGNNGSGKTSLLHCLIDILCEPMGNRWLHGQAVLVFRENNRLFYYSSGEKKDFVLKKSAVKKTEYKEIEKVNKETMGICLRGTKLMYMTHSLTWEDFLRNQNQRSGRYDFLYDCSSGALVQSDARLDVNRELYGKNNKYMDLGSYFIYEQYKQIKFVFDRKQYSNLEEMKKMGYPVPLPQRLYIDFLLEEQLSDWLVKEDETGIPETLRQEVFYNKYENLKAGYDKWTEGDVCAAHGDFLFWFLSYSLLQGCAFCALKSALRCLGKGMKMALIDSIMEWINCQAKEEADWYGRDKFEKIINIIWKFLKNKVKKDSTNTRLIDFVKLEDCYTEFCSFVMDVHELKKHFTIEKPEGNIYYDPMSIGRISVQTEDAVWFMGFLKKYRYICEPDYFLDFSWNLSNGENSLLSLFASFYYIFDADYASGRHGEYKIKNLCNQKMYDCNSVILLIDEADLTYHPEWQREYIALLTKFITMVYPKSCCKDIQIMLTTHSPLLLSDIPQSNVIYLNLDREGKKIVLDTSGKVGTFGQNILLILRDGFFLKGTMGHFAQNKIADINKEVQKIKEEISVMGDRNMSEGEKSETASALQSKKALAELIAEPIIRRKLIQDIDGCITFLSGQPAGDDLSNLSDDELDTRINRMKEELARRKS